MRVLIYHAFVAPRKCGLLAALTSCETRVSQRRAVGADALGSLIS
jgi:hypothetical protein